MINKNTTPNIELKQRKCIEGIYVPYRISQNCIKRLHGTCCSIVNNKDAIYEALHLAWSYIDSVNRIREILQATPRLKKDDKILQKFLKATAIAEEFRNYIQHLRNNLNNNEYLEAPVWGGLSWVDNENPQKSYMALFGAQVNGITYAGCTYDTKNKTWVSIVCLSIIDKTFHFYPINEYLVEYILHFAKMLEDSKQQVNQHLYEPLIISSEYSWYGDNRFLIVDKELGDAEQSLQLDSAP